MRLSKASRPHSAIDGIRQYFYDIFCLAFYLGTISLVSAAILTKVQYFRDVLVTKEATDAILLDVSYFYFI